MSKKIRLKDTLPKGIGRASGGPEQGMSIKMAAGKLRNKFL